MPRAMRDHERAALSKLMAHLRTNQQFLSCQVEPQNADESILEIILPATTLLGRRVHNLSYGIFLDRHDLPVGYVNLLGDELHNPLELDFYDLNDGLMLSRLGQFDLKVCPLDES